MHLVLAAVVVVVVLVLAVWWWKRRGFSEEKGPMWDSQGAGVYTCPGSRDPAYCLLPADKAREACLADPRCVGYLIPEEKKAWALANPGSAQLVSAPPAPNSSDDLGQVTYYRKK